MWLVSDDAGWQTSARAKTQFAINPSYQYYCLTAIVVMRLWDEYMNIFISIKWTASVASSPCQFLLGCQVWECAKSPRRRRADVSRSPTDLQMHQEPPACGCVKPPLAIAPGTRVQMHHMQFALISIFQRYPPWKRTQAQFSASKLPPSLAIT